MAVDTTINAPAERAQSGRFEMPTTIDELRRSGIGDSSLPAIDVNDLKVYYDSEAGVVKAVDGVSFTLLQGERLALVGESGCGKTTLGMALMKLTKPPGYIDGGEILLDGRDLVPLNDEEMRLARLAEIALVTQSAMNALNPVMRIEDQIFDGLIDHGIKDTKENLRNHVYDLLRRVGLRENVGRMYPHELSGGMKQRVAIATGTSMNPKVIVADEPTSALDVVVQRQVMMTLSRVQRDTGAAVILIGHDMGLVAQFADRIGVMYAGKLVDIGTVQQIIEEPKHPYTKTADQQRTGSRREARASDGNPRHPASIGRPTTRMRLRSQVPFSRRCLQRTGAQRRRHRRQPARYVSPIRRRCEHGGTWRWLTY